MEITVKAEVYVSMIVKPEGGKPLLKETKIFLDMDRSLEKSAYVNPDGGLTAAGVQSMTATLIQGLNCSIQSAHQSGIRDSAEHLRYVISELERAFVMPSKTDIIEV